MRIRLALAQLNTVVGDLEGNRNAILRAYSRAEEHHADLVVFPELATCGYPPEDLLHKEMFVDDVMASAASVAHVTGEAVAVFGSVTRAEPTNFVQHLYNSAIVASHGEIHDVYNKRLLPNYGVFDEERYFVPGSESLCLTVIAGVRVGVVVCEDSWFEEGPIAEYAALGAELIVCINASPYAQDKDLQREAMLADRCRESDVMIVYLNQVGGQDELVFDGASLVLDANGAVVMRAPQFVEELLVFDLDVVLRDVVGSANLECVSVSSSSRAAETDFVSPVVHASLDSIEELYDALVCGTRDYLKKSGFSDAVIGLSGGIDSSLVAAIAVDALGSDHVHGVSMPSRYSSAGSRTDAAALADALGVDMRTIAIEPAHTALLEMAGPFARGLTEENLQSRIRGVVLMAISNDTGWMVLTTGNKSELAVGYSTLYGDTAGGFAVIKDVFKTRVYELCRYVNARAGREVISEAVLTKASSAELRPDQRDDQSLPPYEVLDPILQAFVEQDKTIEEMIDSGFDAEISRRVARLVDLAEYKRRQSPLGVRVSEKAFGKDRRMPIMNRYSR